MHVKLPPFQRLLDEHRDDVHRFLVASAGPQEADDCFQETFIAALRSYPRVRDSSNLRAWLLTIAHRKAIDAHRARGRRPVPVAEPRETAAAASNPNPGDPELWERVRALPPKQRGAVVLRYVGDLPHEDIARALRCSEDAARRSLHEGLAKLRKESTR